MEYNHKLLQAEVIAPYNNLIIDTKLADGQVITAFSGATEIAEMCAKGTTVWLKRTEKKYRLIKYNIAFVKTPEGLIFTNPKYNRQLFQEAFENGVLSDLKEYTTCRSLGKTSASSCIDFELSNEIGKKAFVFVTSIYNKQNGCAAFPNAINFFQIRMLEEMYRLKQSCAETYVFMIVPREDCISARFVWNLDPRAAASLFEAAKNGLNFLCYSCKINKNAIEINQKLDILY